jgi:hypothetical protein
MSPLSQTRQLSPVFTAAMNAWSRGACKETQWNLQLDREGPDPAAPWVTVCEDGTPYVAAIYGPSAGLSDCPRGPLGFTVTDACDQFHVEALHGGQPIRTFPTAQAAFAAIIPRP